MPQTTWRWFSSCSRTLKCGAAAPTTLIYFVP
jgi:hypothetical protein